MSESYRPYLLEIRGDLCLSEFHIGSGARLSLSTDAPILRDSNDRPYVPASSLRGVLRSHLEREAALLVPGDKGPELFSSLFGETPNEDAKSISRAGRLCIFDASVAEDRVHAEIRDHVKINSKHGAAEFHAKFDQEVAGAAKLKFRMVYEGQADTDGELCLVEEVIRALEGEELSCGAKGGLGYGRMRLEGTQYRAFDRTQPDGLSQWLVYRSGEQVHFGSEFSWPRPPVSTGPFAPIYEPLCRLDLRLLIQCEGPVLVRAPVSPVVSSESKYDARLREHDVEKGLLAADRTFVQTGADERYYLPAASLRGVLRHQAERIAKVFPGTSGFIDLLFGEVAKDARKGIIEVGSGTLRDKGIPVYLDHVAIDRITGFAADAKKFSTCGLQSPAFENVIRLRFRPKDLHLVALSGFVLRDLLDGMLWCGGGTSRGFGYIKSARVLESVLDWTPSDTVPSDFLPEVPREPRSGRVRISISDLIPFDSWFWRAAQDAWHQCLQPPATGGQLQ